MDRHRSRHSMAFSTPQSQKFTSSQSRRSVSALDADSTCALETLFETLMNDPTKRDVVMKLLMQDKRKLEEIKRKQGNLKKGLENSSPLKKVKQRFACESPTALMRRKALEQRNEEDPWSSTRAVTPSPVPFEHLLQGVIAYVEVISNNCDRSGGAKTLLRAMGAVVKDTFTRDVTHVVFKDGSFNTYQKAKLMKTHLVSVLWLETIRRNHARVPEKNYPALGTDMFKANLSLLCEEMQKDYEDVVRDELSRTVAVNCQDNSSTSSKSSTPTNAQSSNNLTEDIIDVSQDCDVFSIASKASRRLSTIEAVPTTPDSLKLHSSPTLTSDSDSSGVGVVNGHAVKKVVSNLLELKDDSKSIKSVDNIQKNAVDKNNSKESAENASSESTSLLTVVKKKHRKSLFNHIDEEDGLVLSPVENVQETRATLHLNADGDRQELINRQGGAQNSAEDMELTGCVNDEFVTKRKTRSISKVRELLNAFGEKSTRNKGGTIFEEPTMQGLIDGRVSVRKPGTREEDFNEETCKAATNRKKSVKRTTSTQNLATNSQVENGNAVECSSKKSVSINNEKKSTRKSSSTQELSSLRLSADSSRTRSITTASEESKSKTEAEVKPKSSSYEARDTKTRKSNSTYELSSLRLSTDSRKTKNSSNNEAATRAENHSTRKTRRSSSSQDLSSLRLSGNTQENKISNELSASKDSSQHKGQKRKSSGLRSRTSGENSYQTISSDSSLVQSVNNALQALNHDISPKKAKHDSLVGKNIQSKENESDTDVESKRVATRRSIRKAKATSRAPPEPPQISDSDDSPPKEKKKVRRLYNLNYCFDEISVPWNEKGGGAKEDAPAVFKKPAPASTAPILLTESALVYVEKLKLARLTSSDSDENVTEVTQKTPLKKTAEFHLPKRKSGRIAKRKKDADEESSTSIGITPQKNRRSTLDFVPKVVKTSGKLKGTQSSKKEKKSSVVCTRFHRPDVQVFQQVVKKLGKFIVEDEVTERTSHLVVGESKRTINMLRGIARGCWILKSEWLYKSLEAREWLPEEDYEVTEFSPAVQQCRQQQQAFGPLYSMDIFENCGPIYITRSSIPRCSDLQELVRLCKGEVTQIQRNALIVVGEFVRNDGVTCVVEKWILDSIMFNKRKAFKNYLITGM